MAVPLKIKIPWWKKCHPRALWHRMKINWVTSPSVKEDFKRDKYGYLIILAGVVFKIFRKVDFPYSYRWIDFMFYSPSSFYWL